MTVTQAAGPSGPLAGPRAVVNCAGISTNGLIAAHDADQVRAEGRGQIVNTESSGGLLAAALITSYVATRPRY